MRLARGDAGDAEKKQTTETLRALRMAGDSRQGRNIFLCGLSASVVNYTALRANAFLRVLRVN